MRLGSGQDAGDERRWPWLRIGRKAYVLSSSKGVRPQTKVRDPGAGQLDTFVRVSLRQPGDPSRRCRRLPGP